jgi:hypothetical protein
LLSNLLRLRSVGFGREAFVQKERISTHKLMTVYKSVLIIKLNLCYNVYKRSARKACMFIIIKLKLKEIELNKGRACMLWAQKVNKDVL